MCRGFLAKVGARLSSALNAASARHEQAAAEGRGLAALQALDAQLAPVAAAGAEAPAAEGGEGTPAGALNLDAYVSYGFTASCIVAALLCLRPVGCSCIWSSAVCLQCCCLAYWLQAVEAVPAVPGRQHSATAAAVPSMQLHLLAAEGGEAVPAAPAAPAAEGTPVEGAGAEAAGPGDEVAKAAQAAQVGVVCVVIIKRDTLGSMAWRQQPGVCATDVALVEFC